MLFTISKKQINKIKNIIMKKISIVTLALLMTVGTFYKLWIIKKYKTQRGAGIEQSVAQ
jgi:hypothetical protein